MNKLSRNMIIVTLLLCLSVILYGCNSEKINEVKEEMTSNKTIEEDKDMEEKNIEK